MAEQTCRFVWLLQLFKAISITILATHSGILPPTMEKTFVLTIDQCIAILAFTRDTHIRASWFTLS